MFGVNQKQKTQHSYKPEKVRDAKDTPGATLKAVRTQSGKYMDNMCQPNSGVNDVPPSKR